jgi:hypothetical protein
METPKRKKYFNTATYLNFRVKNRARPNSLPTPDKVPILIPKESLDVINVEGSYAFVEAIQVPTEGAGGIYTAEYFNSLLEYMKQYPIPGSKNGHGDQGDDFYTVGGELQLTNENEGVCYFHIIVPPTGWNSSNEALIRSLKSGVPELSIVANVEGERGNDGKVYFRKEFGRPRNDIVPEGAMDVAIGNSVDEKEIMALIQKGAIDMDSESEELVKNGKVFRKAAVKLQSTSDKALAGRVLNAIAEKTKKSTNRRNSMDDVTLDDVINWLKNGIANNQFTIEKLVGLLGGENKLRNASDEQLAELRAAIIKIMGLAEEADSKTILSAVEDAFKEAETAADSVVDIAASELAGGKTVQNAEGKDEENPVYLYAKKNMKGLRGKELNAKVEELKKDPIMITLRSKQADIKVNAKESQKPSTQPSENGTYREV